MSWEAVVEVWPSETVLYVPVLPGFFTKGRTVGEAFQRAGNTIDAYASWLVDDEFLETPPKPGPVFILQELAGQDGAGPFFDIDHDPPEEDFLEVALAIGREFTSELLYQFDNAPAGHRDEFERILRHVAELDRWYANRLLPGIIAPASELEADLIESASAYEETIDELFLDTPAVTRTIGGETWSLSKALRRRTVHLNEHLLDLAASPPPDD
jgi:hypothetical protein